MLRLGGGGNNDDYSDISDTESNSSSSSANTVVSVVEERRKRTILDKVKDTILPDKEDSREEEAMTAGTSRRQKAPESDLLIELSERLAKLERRDDEERDTVCPVKPPNFRKRPARYSLGNSNDLKVIQYNYSARTFHDGTKGQSIHDFLFLLSEAFKSCPVNEEDFKKLLVQRTSGPALDIVSGMIADKEDVEDIYSELYLTFSEGCTAHEARSILKRYTIPRSYGLSQAISEIGMLGQIAGRTGAGPKQNRHFLSTLTQDALESALPDEAWKICHKAISRERFRKGREPTFRDIRKCLRPETEHVDFLIAKNKDFKFAPKRKLFSVCTKAHYKDEVVPAKRAKYSNEVELECNDTQSGQKDSKEKGKGKGKQESKKNLNNSNKTPSSKKSNETKKEKNPKDDSFCSFCGEHTHNSYQGCYSCVDENKKVYMGPGAKDPCSICLPKVKDKLRHPENYCPLRPKMLEMYKAGELRPRGKFKTWCKENNIIS